MKTNSISWFSLLLTLKLFILFQAPTGSTQPDQPYKTCLNSFSCGNITDIGYPFRGSNDPPNCGHPSLVLSCDDRTNITNINILTTKFRVLEIDEATQTMRISREDMMEGSNCPTEISNTTLDFTLFDYAAAYKNYTFLYGCNPFLNINGSLHTSCGVNINGWHDDTAFVILGVYGPGIACKESVVVPAPPVEAENGGFENVSRMDIGVFQEGFLIRWKIGSQQCSDCTATGGRCGYDLEMNQTTCYCADPPYVSDRCVVNTPFSEAKSPGHDLSNSQRIIVIVAAVALAGVGLGWLIFYGRQRAKKSIASKSVEIVGKEIYQPPSSKGLSSVHSTHFTKSIPSYPSPKSELVRRSSYFGVQVFNYGELEEATNNFDPSRELGDGGFGIVYYGVLRDGRTVAVKRLYENNFKRLEQFMNELEILTKLRHQNLVKLYGCTSKRSRELLLVYEYISNGTVADHLHGKRAKSGLLSWPIRLNIAVQTAEALAYLHKSDTIHRDVKTTNILLDNDFHVKVADFGLSRLFPNDVTHVSTAPQGTPGYVDPEYYQCYQLTEKSDVYSFGVVLIELISSLKAVDTNRHRHDINLSNMAVNKIQNRMLHELVDKSLGFEANNDVRRMVTLVAELAFRCLQQEKDMRPSMEEVLEGLRRIQNGDLNEHKVDVVDISMDEDAGLLKGSMDLPSPDSCHS